MGTRGGSTGRGVSVSSNVTSDKQIRRELMSDAESLSNKRSMKTITPIIDKMKEIAFGIQKPSDREEVLSAIGDLTYSDRKQTLFSDHGLNELKYTIHNLGMRPVAVSSMAGRQTMQSQVNLWNFDPNYGVRGHDKVYEIETWKDHDSGEYTVIARWGRRGNKLSQQVKYQGPSEREANSVTREIERQKRGRGYDLQGRLASKSSTTTRGEVLEGIAVIAGSLGRNRNMTQVESAVEDMKRQAFAISDPDKKASVLSAIDEITYRDKNNRNKVSQYALDELNHELAPRAVSVSSMAGKATMQSQVQLHCYDPYYGQRGHDKVYELETWRDTDTGEYTVIARWGRRGAKLSQQVKYQGPSESQARSIARDIEWQKRRKGYDLQERKS